MKTCFKCHRQKPLVAFYRHPQMKDGHLNKCKDCNKIDVQTNYRTNRDHYVAYERGRANLPKRRALAAKGRKQNPVKSKARTAVANAVRDGKLTPMPCRVCGSKRVQGHHADYGKPLEVDWLCYRHHRELHGQTVTVGAELRTRGFVVDEDRGYPHGQREGHA